MDICEKRVDIDKVAIGIDIRGQKFWEGVGQALNELRKRSYETEIIFLDASDDVLMKRYSETRRPHPLSKDGEILSGIHIERQITGELREVADWVVDTTHLNIHSLRAILIEHLKISGKRNIRELVLRLQSFGYKYGIPLDSDLIFDVRFLPNPFFETSLKPLCGYDDEVINFVMKFPETVEFLEKIVNLLDFLILQFEKEGKPYIVVSIGCTGGRHRSVVITEKLAEKFKSRIVEIFHRDLERG